MTREEAKLAEAMFREIGGFDRIEVVQFGWARTNPWHVNLWIVSAKAGNRTLTAVSDTVPDMASAKRIAKEARTKAKARDKEALSQIAAGKEIDSE
jgi:hypothetical protein